VPAEINDGYTESRSDSQIIDDLLKGARSNINDLKLTSPLGDNAFEKYRTVLNIEPENAEALNGLDKIVDEYIHLMDHALETDNISTARNYLRKGTNVNPNHYGLTDAERRLNAAVETRERELREQALIEQEAMQRQQEQEKQDQQQIIQEEEPLVSNPDKQKLEELKQKLSANPKDKKARRELKKIADKYQNKIKMALEDKDFDLAEDYVLEILDMTPENAKAHKELTKLLGKIRTKKYEYNQ